MKTQNQYIQQKGILFSDFFKKEYSKSHYYAVKIND